MQDTPHAPIHGERWWELLGDGMGPLSCPCHPQDGDLLEESSHLSFVYEDNECSLVVLGAAESDSGVYTCTAKNLAGEVSCKAELVVRAGTAGRPPGPGGQSLGARLAPRQRLFFPQPSPLPMPPWRRTLCTRHDA